jgi:hypothetical protein
MMLPTKFQFIWESSFRGEDFFRNQPIRNKNQSPDNFQVNTAVKTAEVDEQKTKYLQHFINKHVKLNRDIHFLNTCNVIIIKSKVLGIGDLRRIWRSCLDPLVYLLPKLFKLFGIQTFPR